MFKFLGVAAGLPGVRFWDVNFGGMHSIAGSRARRRGACNGTPGASPSFLLPMGEGAGQPNGGKQKQARDANMVPASFRAAGSQD